MFSPDPYGVLARSRIEELHRDAAQARLVRLAKQGRQPAGERQPRTVGFASWMKRLARLNVHPSAAPTS